MDLLHRQSCLLLVKGSGVRILRYRVNLKNSESTVIIVGIGKCERSNLSLALDKAFISPLPGCKSGHILLVAVVKTRLVSKEPKVVVAGEDFFVLGQISDKKLLTKSVFFIGG